MRRKRGCGSCERCMVKENCGRCHNCINRKTLKQKCAKRMCLRMIQPKKNIIVLPRKHIFTLQLSNQFIEICSNLQCGDHEELSDTIFQDIVLDRDSDKVTVTIKDEDDIVVTEQSSKGNQSFLDIGQRNDTWVRDVYKTSSTRDNVKMEKTQPVKVQISNPKYQPGLADLQLKSSQELQNQDLEVFQTTELSFPHTSDTEVVQEIRTDFHAELMNNERGTTQSACSLLTSEKGRKCFDSDSPDEQMEVDDISIDWQKDIKTEINQDTTNDDIQNMENESDGSATDEYQCDLKTECDENENKNSDDNVVNESGAGKAKEVGHKYTVKIRCPDLAKCTNKSKVWHKYSKSGIIRHLQESHKNCQKNVVNRLKDEVELCETHIEGKATELCSICDCEVPQTFLPLHIQWNHNEKQYDRAQIALEKCYSIFSESNQPFEIKTAKNQFHLKFDKTLSINNSIQCSFCGLDILKKKLKAHVVKCQRNHPHVQSGVPSVTKNRWCRRKVTKLVSSRISSGKGRDYIDNDSQDKQVGMNDMEKDSHQDKNDEHLQNTDNESDRSVSNESKNNDENVSGKCSVVSEIIGQAKRVGLEHKYAVKINCPECGNKWKRWHKYCTSGIMRHLRESHKNGEKIVKRLKDEIDLCEGVTDGTATEICSICEINVPETFLPLHIQWNHNRRQFYKSQLALEKCYSVFSESKKPFEMKTVKNQFLLKFDKSPIGPIRQTTKKKSHVVKSQPQNSSVALINSKGDPLPIRRSITKYRIDVQCPLCRCWYKYGQREVMEHLKQQHEKDSRHIDVIWQLRNEIDNLNQVSQSENKSETSESESSGSNIAKCDICERSICKEFVPLHIQFVHPRSEFGRLHTLLGKYYELMESKDASPVEFKTLKFGFNLHFMKRVRNVKTAVCEFCQVEIEERIVEAHSRSCKQNPQRVRPKRLVCFRCQFRTKNEDELLEHKKSCRKPFYCEYCGIDCRSPGNYITHRKYKHRIVTPHTTPLKDYPCEVCSKVYHLPSQLKTHMISHSEVRNYVCEMCAKSYKYPTKLKRHIELMHQNIYRFHCDKCGHGVSNKALLRKHVCGRTRRRKKPYNQIITSFQSATANSMTGNHPKDTVNNIVGNHPKDTINNVVGNHSKDTINNVVGNFSKDSVNNIAGNHAKDTFQLQQNDKQDTLSRCLTDDPGGVTSNVVPYYYEQISAGNSIHTNDSMLAQKGVIGPMKDSSVVPSTYNPNEGMVGTFGLSNQVQLSNQHRQENSRNLFGN